MDQILLVVGGVISLLGLGYFILLYNNFVRLKHNIKQAWSNIDVLLKQRHDELPKLVESCQQYMGYEQKTINQVVAARGAVHQARQNGDIKSLGNAETALRVGLGALYAVAENYPDLKASETFLHLQSRISEIEENIADRREFYNSSVNENNIRIEQFPDNIVARLMHFLHADLLEFEESEKKDVDINALFNVG